MRKQSATIESDLLNKICGSFAIRNGHGLRQGNIRLLLRHLTTVLAFQLDNHHKKSHQKPQKSHKTLRSNRKPNGKPSDDLRKLGRSKDLESVDVVGIITAITRLEVGEVLQLRREAQQVEHHRRGLKLDRERKAKRSEARGQMA